MADAQAWYTFPTWFKWGDREGNGGTEKGVDFLTPFHTPIFELFGGQVVASGYHPWGGEVDVRSTLPLGLGTFTESYVHLDRINNGVKPGAKLNPGDSIGLSGGENPGYPGAEHPADPQFSSRIHTEYDLWASTPWASQSVDPLPIIEAAAKGGVLSGPNPVQQGLNDLGAGITAGLTGAITGVWQSIWKTLGVDSGKDLLWRSGFIVVGLILTLIGLALLFKGSAAAAPGQQLLQVLSQGGGGSSGGKSSEGGQGEAAGAPPEASGAGGASGVGEAAAAAA